MWIIEETVICHYRKECQNPLYVCKDDEWMMNTCSDYVFIML